MTRQIIISPDLTACKTVGFGNQIINVAPSAYGWDVFPDHFPEWQISIRCSTMQSGDASIMVSLTQVDCHIRHFTVKAEKAANEIMYMIFALTQEAHWLSPINDKGVSNG